MDALREVFSERLRKGLTLAGINQRQLAEAANTTPNTVQRWLKGENWPSSEVICQLADLLNVTPQWLLGGTAENVTPGVPKQLLKMLAEWPDDVPWDQLLAIAEVISEHGKE